MSPGLAGNLPLFCNSGKADPLGRDEKGGWDDPLQGRTSKIVSFDVVKHIGRPPTSPRQTKEGDAASHSGAVRGRLGLIARIDASAGQVPLATGGLGLISLLFLDEVSGSSDGREGSCSTSSEGQWLLPKCHMGRIVLPRAVRLRCQGAIAPLENAGVRR